MKPITAHIPQAQQRFARQEQAHKERKTRLQSEEARYTVILHHPRKQLGATINEYCLADTVHKLSGSRSMVPGWCYASKEHLADSLGFSRRSIHNMINSLKSKNVLEVQEGTGYLRTTEHWIHTVEIFRDKVFGR
jgi:hypothetical protein